MTTVEMFCNIMPTNSLRIRTPTGAAVGTNFAAPWIKDVGGVSLVDQLLTIHVNESTTVHINCDLTLS